MFRYILRYYIDPGFQEEERIAELIDFCQEAKVDEVMLFFNPEEVNSGHPSMEELLSWLAMARKIKQRLSQENIGLSINPWTTTVHSPRGRKLKKGQDFTLMVGENGHDNGVTSCPMCPNWLDYICEMWSLIARELEPAAIWIEDDWRYHNHGRALGFGGCYCQLHLDEFSRRVGRQVSREELIAAIYAPGTPHPWRAVWMELNNQSIVRPIEKIRKKVQQSSPSTRIALMCGGVDVNSIEGRDWHQLQQAAGFEPAFMVRPTISPYTEVWPMRQYPVPARMIVAALKRPLEICPEMESGPRHGPYSKGCGIAGRIIEQCAAFGAHAITINHYDMLGCGTTIDTRFAAMLRRIKPRLEALRKLELDDDNSLGANILFSPRVAQHLHSTRPGATQGLDNFSGEWGNLSAILGFSCRFTTAIAPSKQAYLVNGQTLNAFSDDEIHTLLKGSVILDGIAAASLIERGFGKEIGITGYTIRHHNIDGYSYEDIPEKDPAIYGVANPRMTMQRACRTLYDFTPLATCEKRSTIRRYDHQEMFAGSLFFRNNSGGRIVTLAAPLGDGGDSEWFYMGYFNCFRRIFLHRLLLECAPEMTIAFAEDLPFQCFRIGFNGGEMVAAFNSTTDQAEELKLFLTNLPAGRFELLDPNGQWRPAPLEITRKSSQATQIILKQAIPVHSSIILRILQ